MGIAYDLSDLARHEVLIDVLSEFSPTDIIESKDLKISFRDFFARGTTEERLQLCQWVYNAALSDTRHHNGLSDTISSNPSLNAWDGVLSSKDPLSCGTLGDALFSKLPGSSGIVPKILVSRPIASPSGAGSQLCISQPQPNADASLSNLDNSITKFFEGKRIRPDRIKRLAGHIRSFEKAEVLPLESYDNLWSDKGKIFAGSENGIRRMCRLQRGRLLIKERMSQYGTAARLCLMFAVADVAHYAHTATPAELELRPHRSRMTAALEKIAKVNDILLKDLHQDKRKSRNYFELLFGPGPGSLLLTGSESTSWEVKTNKEDVRLVLEYIQTQLPELYSTLISLNGVGARTIVKGLLAYGWTLEEVKSSPIPFIKAVRKYLDENLMIPIPEGGVLTAQNPHHTTQSSKKRASDDFDAGHTKADHVHTLHRSKQTHCAFDNQKIAETSLPDNFGVKRQRPGRSMVTADSSPPSELTVTELERPAATDASTGDILDGITMRDIEDDSIDPWMAHTLRYCEDSTESWILTHRLQRSSPSCSGQREAVSMNPHMTSTLGAVDCLPSSLEPSSSGDGVLTINPNLLTMDPSMTSSLGAVDSLPFWSKIQVDGGFSQNIQT